MRILQPLKNESGFAFLLTVMIVALVIVTLGYFASISTNMNTSRRAELREQIAAMMVLEQIGVIFKQASDEYRAQPTGICPPGFAEMMISTVKHCIPTSKTVSCAQDPRTDLWANTLICSVEAPTGGYTSIANGGKSHVIARVEAVTPLNFERIRKEMLAAHVPYKPITFLDSLALLLGNFGFKQKLDFFSNPAQAAQNDLPTAAALGGSTNTITQPDPANYLELCSGGAGKTDAICVTATVCMRSSCPLPGQHYQQIFAYTN